MYSCDDYVLQPGGVEYGRGGGGGDRFRDGYVLQPGSVATAEVVAMTDSEAAKVFH